MTSLDHSQETRLNVRISGPLANHVNRQVDSNLYRAPGTTRRSTRTPVAVCATCRRALSIRLRSSFNSAPEAKTGSVVFAILLFCTLNAANRFYFKTPWLMNCQFLSVADKISDKNRWDKWQKIDFRLTLLLFYSCLAEFSEVYKLSL